MVECVVHSGERLRQQFVHVELHKGTPCLHNRLLGSCPCRHTGPKHSELCCNCQMMEVWVEVWAWEAVVQVWGLQEVDLKAQG
jgi:hypothetical protein